MNTKLEKKIYNAQCIGNVEPIEYMTPYPSMRSLVEGQTIKFSDQLIIQEKNITNRRFFCYIQQTSNWLESLGLKPKDRIIMPNLKYPQSEILLYGIWNIGASVVLPAKINFDEIKKKSDAKDLITSTTNLFNKIKKYSKSFEPKYKPLLYDEAVLSFEKSHGIRLSHYNLLINASGIQKAIGIKSRTHIHCDVLYGTTYWVVFKAILPIYCGCVYDSIEPDLTIGLSGNDYNIRLDLKKIDMFNENDIAICIENSAALSIGKKPIHLTEYSLGSDSIKIKGHSVMLGYLDASINEKSFIGNSLNISF